MAGDEIFFDFSELEDRLQVDYDRASNIGGVLSAIGDVLLTAIDDEIQSEGRGRWPPLADSTIAKRRKGGKGARMLQDTGLLASIQTRIGSDFVQAYSPAPYAIFHTSDAPRSLIPKRDFFDVDRDDVFEEVADIILDAMTRGR